MIDRGACMGCHTVWWACRCPNRCPECGHGYQDNSSCYTPGCGAGEARASDLYWRHVWPGEEQDAAEPAAVPIRCEAVEPVAADPILPKPVPVASPAETSTTGEASVPTEPTVEDAPPAAKPERAMARARRERRSTPRPPKAQEPAKIEA